MSSSSFPKPVLVNFFGHRPSVLYLDARCRGRQRIRVSAESAQSLNAASQGMCNARLRLRRAPFKMIGGPVVVGLTHALSPGVPFAMMAVF
jgi:hypothetical protein